MKNSTSLGLCTLMVLAAMLVAQAQPDEILHPRMREELPLGRPTVLWRSLFLVSMDKSPKEISSFMQRKNAWVDSEKLSELKELPEWESEDCRWGLNINIHAPTHKFWPKKNKGMLVEDYLRMRREKCKKYFEDKFDQLFDEVIGPTLTPDQTLALLEDIQYFDPSLDEQIAELIYLDMPARYRGRNKISESSPTMLKGKSSVAIENYKKDRLAKIEPFFEALKPRLKLHDIIADFCENDRGLYRQLQMITSELERLSDKKSYDLTLDEVDRLMRNYLEAGKDLYNGSRPTKFDLRDPDLRWPCKELIGSFNEDEIQSLRTKMLLGLVTNEIGMDWMRIFVACKHIVGGSSA